MDRIKNIQKITEIVMHPIAITKCRIGQDWFKNEFEIIFTPGEYYPDYMKVNTFIAEEIDGYEMNIEDAVDALYEYLQKYEPKKLRIIDRIRDSKTHFDVTVIKE